MSLYAGSADDNDPSIIYSGTGWELITTDGTWKGTMHSTSTPGSWARFRFTGSRVVVVCTIPTGNGSLSKASFQLDDGPAVPVSHRTTAPVRSRTQFWDSGPLPFGSHLLTITNMDNDAYFRMDRIDFDPTDSNAPRQSSTLLPRPTPPPISPPDTSNPLIAPYINSTAAGGSQHPTSGTSNPSTGSGGSSSSRTKSSDASSSDSTQNPGFTPSSATSTSPPPDSTLVQTGGNSTRSAAQATIAAYVLGGIILLALVGILGYFWLRRRRRRVLRLQYSETFDGPRMLQPQGTPDPMHMMPTSPRPFTQFEHGYSPDGSAPSSPSSQSQSRYVDAHSSQASMLDSKY